MTVIAADNVNKTPLAPWQPLQSAPLLARSCCLHLLIVRVAVTSTRRLGHALQIVCASLAHHEVVCAPSTFIAALRTSVNEKPIIGVVVKILVPSTSLHWFLYSSMQAHTVWTGDISSLSGHGK